MAKTLLPPGCYDLLPPFARLETELVYSLLSTFEANGYAQASPPLLEYTESLLAGRGAALAPQVFRLMDASTHQVMGLRSDITLQIARIASARLTGAPLPLRLSYAGPVLRASSNSGRSGRQLAQAGIELIGPDAPEADAEVIIIAAKALQKAGLSTFTIDLNMPGIVLALLESEALDNDTLSDLMQAVAHKDAAAIRHFDIAQHAALEGLLAAAGTAEEALAVLGTLNLPPLALQQVAVLERVATLVQAALPGSADLMVDVTEARGLEYHTGVTFSFFADGAPSEIGFGGRYRIDNGLPAPERSHAIQNNLRNGASGFAQAGGTRREATGCTLYVNTLCRLLPVPAAQNRIFIATPADGNTISALQEQGYVTIRALPGYPTDRAAAAEQGCSHYFADGRLEEL